LVSGIRRWRRGAPTQFHTTEFAATGNVVAPATYDLATLGLLPATTETVTFKTGAGPHTGTFTGPTLWTLLSAVGLQTPAVKNGVLRQYVIAEGSDGYIALFSLGELNPNFGGSNPRVLVGYQENNAPLGSTGFARIVAAKDDFGGRYVSNLANLLVGTAPSNPPQGGGTTTQFSLSGAVQRRGSICCRASRRSRQRPRPLPISPPASR
jgi:hypothetical protein